MNGRETDRKSYKRFLIIRRKILQMKLIYMYMQINIKHKISTQSSALYVTELSALTFHTLVRVHLNFRWFL